MEKTKIQFYSLLILAVTNLILLCVYLGYCGYALYLVDKHSKFNKRESIYRAPFDDDDIDFRFNDGDPTFYGVMLILGLIARFFMLVLLQLNNYFILKGETRHDIVQQIPWNIYVLSGLIPDIIINIIIVTKINEDESAPEIYYLLYPIMSLILMVWPLIVFGFLGIMILCIEAYEKFKHKHIRSAQV